VPPLPSTPDVFSRAIPVITTLSGRIYQRGMNHVLQAGWQPAKGALTYQADVSYDGQQTWVRAYDGENTTFEAIVGSAQTVFVRVAGIAASGVTGQFSVIQINPPRLVLDNSFFVMRVQPDDMIPELSRRLDGLDLLDQVADLAGE